MSQRRYLHANPELSWQEHRTTDYIVAQLTQVGLVPRILPHGTGVICDIGPDYAKPRIALRADIDALPIEENTGVSFTSMTAGVSHACGHDLHCTILLGVGSFLAHYVVNHKLNCGVRLIFQPAEEKMPGGALSVIEAGELADIGEILALHCDPKLFVGEVGVTAGAITSAADRITLTVRGKGGHTARPHLTSDTIGALATVINQLPYLLSRKVEARTATVMVWGSVHAGNAPNAIPTTGVASGTIRTADRDTWLSLADITQNLIAMLLAPYEIDYELEYHRGVPPVINDSAVIDRVLCACSTLGDIQVAATPQSSGGEDFAWYLEKIPGAMLRLGVGAEAKMTYDLHQPDFLPDEKAIEVGVRLFISYVNCVQVCGE